MHKIGKDISIVFVLGQHSSCFLLIYMLHFEMAFFFLFEGSLQVSLIPSAAKCLFLKSTFAI
jgi:hypothetical protein